MSNELDRTQFCDVKVYLAQYCSARMKSKELEKIFLKEMDAEVLDKMPEWFKRLREDCMKRKNHD